MIQTNEMAIFFLNNVVNSRKVELGYNEDIKTIVDIIVPLLRSNNTIKYGETDTLKVANFYTVLYPNDTSIIDSYDRICEFESGILSSRKSNNIKSIAS